ncbi:MAG: class I SAM-dependent methyltransferase [Proteobacteria bacterium]|nr:class I SAM-dependent methyltransferase [Pseudomonadota bacterium]MBU4258600.1 class I SAM-dependent methyltransferase [Pseudomonadota bacterium]MBU4287666.1 class I SAM-dependent methyltransferase [Pseudomonadota bacterium]MBU4413549.1 class I SAM-dependent methyltransferase [Pseudomonadota bacterium]MCG2759554.1 class I SAM-dependent methyltransferase [Desulfobacteraceae bacterium]
MNSENDYEVIKKCRVCGSLDVVDVLDLGMQPLANSLKQKANAQEEKYPLTLAFCQDCSLVQLRETIRKEILFDSYVWVTGTSETAKDYAKTFYERTVNISGLKKGDLVIEIASNDGIFLKPFYSEGFSVIGIEPAKNIAAMAKKIGIRTFEAYWNLTNAEKIVSDFGYAHVIFARNVIPHVSELHSVIQGIECCLDPEGVGIIEFHYSGIILEELHYDSIYHEHLCYFSIRSLEYLLNQFNLFSFHIDTSPISGGSYVIYFSRKKRQQSENYLNLLEKENLIGVNNVQTWNAFAKSCYEHREKSIDIAESFSSKTVLGFGASARSSTYLNFCGFDSAHIKAIIDNNPLKQGMYSPGGSIPIVTLKSGMQMNPDLIFILAWNFRDEIIKECRVNGYVGEFLVAFPQSPYYFRG